jgi:hypothetical protein
MHQYMNEDEAWRRLQDIQREMENRRLMAAGQPNATYETIKQLAARVWLLAGLAAMRPPRRRPTTIREDGDRRSRFV